MPPTERVFAGRTMPAFTGALQASPSQFWTTGEENLRVTSWSSVSSVVVLLHYRFLKPDGTIVANSERHLPTGDRFSRSEQFSLGQGSLLNMTVFADPDGASPRIGQCFVRVQLVRGFSGGMVVMGTMLQGYISKFQDLAWPGSPILSSLEGFGCYRSFIGTTPIAGAEIAEECPIGARWRLQSFETTLVTVGAGAARSCLVVLSAFASGILFVNCAPTNVAPGTSARFTFAPGLPYEVSFSSAGVVCGLPDPMMMRVADRIATSTNNFNAADVYIAPRLNVQEWLEVDL